MDDRRFLDRELALLVMELAAEFEALEVAGEEAELDEDASLNALPLRIHKTAKSSSLHVRRPAVNDDVAFFFVAMKQSFAAAICLIQEGKETKMICFVLKKKSFWKKWR